MRMTKKSVPIEPTPPQKPRTPPEKNEKISPLFFSIKRFLSLQFGDNRGIFNLHFRKSKRAHALTVRFFFHMTILTSEENNPALIMTKNYFVHSYKIFCSFFVNIKEILLS